MSELFEYKCPNCGGALRFDAGTQNLLCPYCGSEIDVEALSSYDKELENDSADNINWTENAGQEWGEGEADNMSVYICKSCGGEIISDENTAASKCPYCDNPVVMKGKLSGALKPDFIIPFKMDKQAAKDAYLRHLSGKKFLPKVFKDQNHIDEIKAVYVPFWLFDADVDAACRYRATKVRMWSDSRNNYTETEYYSVYRAGTIAFDNVPVDGSESMDDELMQSIEPFDFSEAKPFSTAYLAGYLADKYSVDADQSIPIANSRIKTSSEEALASTVHGYASVVPEAGSIRMDSGKAKYALYPVWILNTTYNRERFIFAMNGQTGKMVGNLPLDKGAYWRNFLTVGGIGAAVVFIIQAAMYMFA